MKSIIRFLLRTRKYLKIKYEYSLETMNIDILKKMDRTQLGEWVYRTKIHIDEVQRVHDTLEQVNHQGYDQEHVKRKMDLYLYQMMIAKLAIDKSLNI